MHVSSLHAAAHLLTARVVRRCAVQSSQEIERLCLLRLVPQPTTVYTAFSHRSMHASTCRTVRVAQHLLAFFPDAHTAPNVVLILLCKYASSDALVLLLTLPDSRLLVHVTLSR